MKFHFPPITKSVYIFLHHEECVPVGMKSNFVFLTDRWPLLASLGELAERNLYHDPNTTLLKLRLFGEKMVKYLLALENMSEPEDSRLVSLIHLLEGEDIIDRQLASVFHSLRKAGNKAAHEGYDSFEEAKTQLSLAYNLAVWFMQSYGEWNFEAKPFVLPSPPDPSEPLEALKQQLEELTQIYDEKVKYLQEELDQLRRENSSREKILERRRRARQKATKLYLTEEETRKLIDQQLEEAGWEVDSRLLRYSKGTRPQKGKNRAIAEWPLEYGTADYALFVGLQLVAIVEAKRKGKDVLSDLEQAKKYAKHVKVHGEEELVGRWRDYRVPFVFAANGRPYLPQYKEKSGIWFQDLRRSSNLAKPLMGWYTPQGLIDLLKQDVESTNQSLQDEPLTYLELRQYQNDAIRAVEKAIAEGQQRILVAMATGTGKTRMAIGLIYRLIKTRRFKRILFLVDRNALGEQAEIAFKESKLENLQTFTELYELQGLKEKEPNPETKVVISTVQAMVRRIMGGSKHLSKPSIDQFDCILVDEAHRGYTLDKEMTELEYQFRDHDDYVSKYTKVLNYFDAVKIGLTATPALHTIQIFGRPVFTYSYRDAVIDGYLVDHEPPNQLDTKLKKYGITWKVGEKVAVYNTGTGEVDTIELPDEVAVEVDQFNKMVITENFNRTILKYLVENGYLDPTSDEKTLIFAVNDNHADMVVRILKEEMQLFYENLDDNAIMKITASIHDPSEAIRRYKNEFYPNIAVTVDLLTTGVDVPKICNLVFLRRVRSRILYEQMLGRATRTCPEINKTHFKIFDAVGLYEALEKVSNMKPVAVNPKVSFIQLVDECLSLDEPSARRNHVEQIIAKIQRKKRNMTEEDMKLFEHLSGGKNINEYVHWLKNAPLEEVSEALKKQTDLFEQLDQARPSPKKKWISEHEDEMVSHTQGYGNAEKPEDFLNEFEAFIERNMNLIPALEIICTRPSDLTREDLRKLKRELDRHGYSEANLRTAWRDMTNQEILADIISFIRQRILGEPLISHEERVKRAMEGIYRMQRWNPMQKKWLKRIEKQLLAETVLGPDAKTAFEVEPFKRHGGYKKLDAIFKGQLQEVLTKINHALFQTRKKA
jgi:type I restriction enzyme, R subunit